MPFSFTRSGRQIYLTVPQEHNMRFTMLFPKFEGHKKIKGNCVFSFEPTGSNIRHIIERFPEAEEILKPETPVEKPIGKFQEKMTFVPKHEPWDYQQEFYAKQRGKPVFALFAEVGAGKTKMGVDTSFERYADGECDAVIIIANKGVHTQWIMDALPEHAPDGMPWVGYCHDQTFRPNLQTRRLKFLAMNFDAAKTAKNVAIINDFIAACKSFRFIIDESQNISNKASQRWGAIFDVRSSGKCSSVLIMSGTPITKDLTNYWAQYFMLDENIIGDRYLSSFKGKYCMLGGFDGRQVIGYQNEVNLFKLTEPYTYRINENDLKLPEKRRKEITFSMGSDMRRAYDNMKETFVADLSDPNSQAAKHAGSALIRLQQITNGYLPNEDGTVTEFENVRLQKLLEVLDGLEGKVIIWARFKYDIETIAKALGDKCVVYYGPTDGKERDDNKIRFITDPKCLYIVGSPGALGTGIDGLQHVCRQNVYYSNSFKAIERWQSEGRTTRKGMGGSSLYIDLICRAGLDRRILQRLRQKRDLSDMMLDDIREFVAAGGEAY